MRWKLFIFRCFRQVGHFFWYWMACLMQFVQKMWPHIVVAGSSNLFQHTGQVKMGSFGATFTGSLLVFPAFFDCKLDPSPVSGEMFITGETLGRLFLVL